MRLDVRSLHRLTCWSLAVVVAAPAAARTYSIATTVDDATVNGNCTLREAIRAARDNAPVDACLAGQASDTIVLPDGTYPFVGQEDFNVDVTVEIRGQSGTASAAVVDLQNAGRFLFLSGNGPGSLMLRSFTVENGNSGVAGGGAIYSYGYALTLEGMRFVGNHGVGQGGAVQYENNRGSGLTVRRTQFFANGIDGRGGGLSASINDGAIDLRDVIFQSNGASSSSGTTGLGAWGGGLLLDAVGTGRAVCVRCLFSSNYVQTSAAGFGAGVYGGGAYFLAQGGKIQVVDATFVSNFASVPADVGALQAPAFVTSAFNGGVIELDRVLVDLSSNTFSNGGADVALFSSSGGYVSLGNAQVTSGSWNGIRAQTINSVVEIAATTVAEYTLGTGVSMDSTGGGMVSLGGSLLAHNATDLTMVGDGNFLFTNCIAMSMGLFPGFVDSGAGDFHLSPASAAVDATVPLPLMRQADRDHRPRFVGIDPDCGAYEVGGLFVDGFEVGDTGSFAATFPG